jgi:hypothetical protein
MALEEEYFYFKKFAKHLWQLFSMLWMFVFLATYFYVDEHHEVIMYCMGIGAGMMIRNLFR